MKRRLNHIQQTLDHLVKKAENPEKYHSKHLKQTQATNALIDSVAEDLPLAVVDSCKYKKFVEILDPTYQVPSRKQFSSVLLKKKYLEVKDKVLGKLSKTQIIHLTIDLWSNHQMRSYLGITGHYISEEWDLESVMLRCNRVIEGIQVTTLSLGTRNLLLSLVLAAK